MGEKVTVDETVKVESNEGLREVRFEIKFGSIVALNGYKGHGESLATPYVVIGFDDSGDGFMASKIRYDEDGKLVVPVLGGGSIPKEALDFVWKHVKPEIILKAMNQVWVKLGKADGMSEEARERYQQEMDKGEREVVIEKPEDYYNPKSDSYDPIKMLLWKFIHNQDEIPPFDVHSDYPISNFKCRIGWWYAVGSILLVLRDRRLLPEKLNEDVDMFLNRSKGLRPKVKSEDIAYANRVIRQILEAIGGKPSVVEEQ